MTRASVALTAAAVLLPLATASHAASSDNWSTFNGDLKAQKYSPADQITPDNVGKLQWPGKFIPAMCPTA